MRKTKVSQQKIEAVEAGELQGKSSNVEIPNKVRRWFNIAFVLSLLMCAVFLVAYWRNYKTGNLFGDESVQFLAILVPIFLRWTYFMSKSIFELNKIGSKTIFFVDNSDELQILIVKLSLLVAFSIVVIELIGKSAWHHSMDNLALYLRSAV